jgi:phosphoribosyl 1,2-cyclic phosphodiesterase
MRILVLASGSSGNAVAVEAEGTTVLLDCGISYRQLGERLHAAGSAPHHIHSVLLSHEHDDHVRGLAVLLRRHHQVRVLATAGTAGAMPVPPPLVEPLQAGRVVQVGAVRIMPVSTSHDAAEPVGFVIEHGGVKAAVVTDTGTVTQLLLERLAGCQVLLLECNHDRDMLRYGPYPWPLKQRIASRTGHLSNEQASVALRQLTHCDLAQVVGMHLSETNNRPEIVKGELAATFAGSAVRVAVAKPREPLVLDTSNL